VDTVIKGRLQWPIPKWIRHYGMRFMPFADAASPDLPLPRLLRLSLFQAVIGMSTALLVGTLNRVMILELGIPAWWVALSVGLPMVFAPFRALIGYRSDTHPSALGLRRIPYLWMGSLMLFGGLAIMPFALLLLSEAQHANQWLGQIGACLAFLLVGAGIQITQTAGMALANDLATEEKRPRVVALLYTMLLMGMIVSSVIFGALLADFSSVRLIKVVQGSAALVLVINLISLWKQEARQSRRGARSAGGFTSSWSALMEQPHMRRFLWTLGLGTCAFSMQEIVLEPYAGEVLGLGVGATSALTAFSSGGSLLAFMLSARWLNQGITAFRLASLGALLGVLAFVGVIFSAPLQSQGLFQASVTLIGFSGGLFSVSMLVSAMTFASPEFSGLVLGAWGGVQATAAGFSMALGGALRDGISHLAQQGALGEALRSTVTGYSAVYHLEMYLLFVVLAALGPMLRKRDMAPQSTSRFGLAELPG
jgi:MFS transporter, BCD family, chlorophyll transporter